MTEKTFSETLAEKTTRTFHERVLSVQQSLQAPKDQTNEFGGYSYRSAEHILGALKPILQQEGLTVHLSDDIIPHGDRHYVQATALLTDGKDNITCKAFARECEQRKGMDAAQITGAASSYARKYALCGLLAIDDASQDPDAAKPVNKSEKIDQAMAHEIENLIVETKSDRAKFFDVFKVTRMMEMTVGQYEQAIAMLLAKKAKQ